MSALELTSKKQFERAIMNGVSVIDFNAHWCRPCRAQAPIMDALNDAYSGKATVAKLNIDKNQRIAMNLGIQSIPTIIIFKEGREMDRFIGLQAAETLERALNAVLT
jgi:thioredoxin 1